MEPSFRQQWGGGGRTGAAGGAGRISTPPLGSVMGPGRLHVGGQEGNWCLGGKARFQASPREGGLKVREDTRKACEGRKQSGERKPEQVGFMVRALGQFLAVGK